MKKLKRSLGVAFCLLALAAIIPVVASETAGSYATKPCDIKNSKGDIVGYGNTCVSGKNSECLPNPC